MLLAPPQVSPVVEAKTMPGDSVPGAGEVPAPEGAGPPPAATEQIRQPVTPEQARELAPQLQEGAAFAEYSHSLCTPRLPLGCPARKMEGRPRLVSVDEGRFVPAGSVGKSLGLDAPCVRRLGSASEKPRGRLPPPRLDCRRPRRGAAPRRCMSLSNYVSNC